MLKPVSIVLLLIFSIAINAQISDKVNLMGKWMDDNLPVSSGLAYNDIWGYTDYDDKEYGIIGSLNATHFIDINTPTNPIEVKRIAGRGNSAWRDYKTYLNYAYGVADAGDASLQIFDLSDLPNTVTKVLDSQEFFTTCHNIYIDEQHGRLYALGTNRASLVVLDLTKDPKNPTLLKNINVPTGYVHDIYVRDHIAYASHVYAMALYVYDLTDLENVKTLGSLTDYVDRGLNHSSWLSDNGKVLTMTDESHNTAVKVIDVTDLSDIEVISTFKSTLEAPVASNSIPHNSFIIGNDYVIVSYYHEGVQIYNIADPTSPYKAGYYDTDTTNSNYGGSIGSWGVYPFFPSGNIIASDIKNGLFVLQPTFDMGYCLQDYNTAETIEEGKMKNRNASKSVNLRNGFHAQVGSEFSARIEACASPPNNILTNKEELLQLPISNAVLSKKEGSAKKISKTRVQIYPNPFSNEFKLLLSVEATYIQSDIQLVNNLGQLIEVDIANCGPNCFTLYNENLSRGIYSILVKKKGRETIIKKVMKL